MRLIASLGVLLCGLLGVEAAQARVRVDVDLGSQTMHVSANGADYQWDVSTARAGYATPRGHYRSGHLERIHYSHKYHMSPMPYSIFFAGGYAIHGTYATGDLGRPASHGCIRLSPGNAAFLYGLVKGQGADIRITGSAPPSRSFAKRHSRHNVAQARRRTRDVTAFGVGGDDWREGEPEVLAFAPPRRSAVSAKTRRVIDPMLRPDYWPQ
jgi:hypothetical protein